MSTRAERQRGHGLERRRHRRAQTTRRYRRLRAEIDLPQAFSELLAWLLEGLGRLRMRARLWRYRNRKAVP